MNYTFVDTNGEPWSNHRPSADADPTAHRFTGHEWDRETDMTYAKGRYYDMELALFSQVDPPLANGTYMGRKPGENSVWTKAGENMNGYWYVMANPVVYTDPSLVTRTN